MKWERQYTMDYSPNGDDVDKFVVGTDADISNLYNAVNDLLTNGATAGISNKEVTAGAWAFDNTTGALYIGNVDGTEWVNVGTAERYFGLTPEKLEAVRNGGNMGKLYFGTDSSKPTSGSSNDFYFAYDKNRLYRWDGEDWSVFLSLNFGDMLNYERYCVSREMLQKSTDENIAGKIPVLDEETGKGNFDISGSPSKIFDKPIDFQELGNLHAIVYNAEKDKFVNLPIYIFDKTNVTYVGDASTEEKIKLVAVGKDGKIKGKFEGEFYGTTDSIGDFEIDFTGLEDGKILAFDSESGKFIFTSKDDFNEENFTETGEAGKLVKVNSQGYIVGNLKGSASKIGGFDVITNGAKSGYALTYEGGKLVFRQATADLSDCIKLDNDGTAHINITGSATAIAGKDVDISVLRDGYVPVYHASSNTIRFEPKNTTGEGQSLILRDNGKLLGDYNGSTTTEIDVAEVVENSNVSYVNHALRLAENIHLALDIAELNPGGYDNLITETFRGDTSIIDATVATVTDLVQGDDSINVETADGLITGANYILTDGVTSETVKIKEIKISGSSKRIILTSPVENSFTLENAVLKRSTATISEGYVEGDDVYFVTAPVKLSNTVSRIHMGVKHQNLKDIEINAEVSLQATNFVESEILGVGDGTEQTVTVANTSSLNFYGFKLYFDGVAQNDFSFNHKTGEVTFTAASGVIVTADYFYNWGEENFVAMTKTAIYPDKNNPARATTQFTFRDTGDGGNVAIIKISLKVLNGTENNVTVGAGTGKAQAFKLEHKAIPATISVNPTSATKRWNENLNALVVTANAGELVRVSYSWKGERFKIDSLAAIFNE